MWRAWTYNARSLSEVPRRAKAEWVAEHDAGAVPMRASEVSSSHIGPAHQYMERREFNYYRLRIADSAIATKPSNSRGIGSGSIARASRRSWHLHGSARLVRPHIDVVLPWLTVALNDDRGNGRI